ncbi:Zn(2)-Cys(6) zinc finger domain protein [Metarhizium robertsii]|uniref:Zn(2)-Cys(6) zinc finger domain protein n=1 Tax=Metarhizium robertsii TaxID=568076 RepID=A0A014PKM0_9HYPO|nr:Zn(2)-Cys(6) zinc finger domain protein [Metarhizium robertsii]
MTRWPRERDAAEHVTCKSDFPPFPHSPRPCCRHAYTPFPRRRCKRRKERCDGRQPCGRCTERRVHNECRYETEHGGRAAKLHPARHRGGSISSSRGRSSVEPPSVTIDIADSSPAATPLDQSRLILDKKGRFMYLGDSANPSFLQSIRRLVRETQGPGPFVDDPLRPAMVEASPEGAPAWLDAGSDHKSPPALTEDEARHFARQFYLCTNGILDLYDKPVLLDQVPRALARDAVALPLAKPVVYLILALGAQSSPKDLGEVAESCFNYGRYLSARYLMDDPSTLAVEAYILIAMYLLAASRRNAAFMHLGFAVRAAYALGLHLKAVSMRFTADEFRRRERIWKSLRSIDILSSALLGRPPATKETRDTAAPDDYSACGDLLAIMEQVLTDVYEQRQISATTLNRVASRQREWAAVFTRGLAADNIEPGDGVEGGAPNMGLTHLKVVFHWTVMLLTRPFLSERVAAHARQAASSSSSSSSPAWTPAESSRVLAHACVNSAIRTLALLEPLVEAWDTPTRLPFSVSCVVHSALVVGLAHFGDMHQIFPLDKSMYTARSLLQRFSSDAIAFRNCTIVRLLHEACQAYAEKRHAASMDMEGQLISSLFGQLHYTPPGTTGAEPADHSALRAFGDDAAADASWDSVSPAKTTVQPLSPSSTPATMPKHDDDAAALPLEVSSVFDGGNILGDEDIVNLESRDDLVSLYALIDTSGGYLGLE